MLLSRGRLNLNRYGIISDKKADQTDLAHRMNQHKQRFSTVNHSRIKIQQQKERGSSKDGVEQRS
jgi:hypothetical protein